MEILFGRFRRSHNAKIRRRRIDDTEVEDQLFRWSFFAQSANQEKRIPLTQSRSKDLKTTCFRAEAGCFIWVIASPLWKSACQRLRNQLAPWLGFFKIRFLRQFSRKNACGFDVSFPGTTDIQQRWKLVLVGNRTTLSLILRSLHRLLLWHRSSLAFQMMNSSHAASFEEDGECNPLSPGYSSLGSWW